MRTSLHLKIAVLIGYVALCTMLVLTAQQGEAPDLSAAGQVDANAP